MFIRWLNCIAHCLRCITNMLLKSYLSLLSEASARLFVLTTHVFHAFHSTCWIAMRRINCVFAQQAKMLIHFSECLSCFCCLLGSNTTFHFTLCVWVYNHAAVSSPNFLFYFDNFVFRCLGQCYFVDFVFKASLSQQIKGRTQCSMT